MEMQKRFIIITHPFSRNGSLLHNGIYRECNIETYAQALNDGFTAYRWDNDLEVHLYQEIEKRVKNPAGKRI